MFSKRKKRSLEEKISSLDSNFNDLEQYGKRKKNNIIVRFISRKNRNNIYKERKKLKNVDAGRPTTQRVFINENLTKKKINSCFTWLMTKEKDLVGNTSGPTMEEFTLDKLMTVKPLLSDMKKTSNRSKSQQPTLEITMDHMHLLTILENPPMKYLSPPFGMVSGLHIVLTFAWCVIIHLIIYLTNNHGSLQKV